MVRRLPDFPGSADHHGAAVFFGSKRRLEVVAFETGTARLQYGYLVALETGRAYFVRRLIGVRIGLQAIDALAHRRFGQHIVPLALLNVLLRVAFFLEGDKFCLKHHKLRLEFRILRARVRDHEAYVHNLVDDLGVELPVLRQRLEALDVREDRADVPAGGGDGLDQGTGVNIHGASVAEPASAGNRGAIPGSPASQEAV